MSIAGSARVADAEQTVTIVNELGLHARAATKFVQLASKFPCDITVAKDGHEVNGKSIMGVLMLVASKGTSVTIRGKGDRAADAVAALVQLVADKFGEDK
jgi:phosphocarrier protein